MAINARKAILIRTLTIYGLMCLFAFAIIGSLYKLQFIEGEKWKSQAKEFSIKRQKIEAIRGNIFDCNGSLLSTSLPIYDIAIDATAPAFAIKDTFNKYVDSLAICLNNEFPVKSFYDFKSFLKNIRSKGSGYNLLKLNVSHQQMLRIKKFPLFRMGKISGGLFITNKTKRVKPFQSLAFRTIGFVNENSNTYVGLEGYFNNYLAGKKGSQLMQRVSGGIYVPINNNQKDDAENGCDVISTIDINLQDVAQKSLLNVLEANNAMRGTVILMEVETGEVKVIANLTRNENGSYEESINDAIGSRMQPGSTFKLVTMMSLLDNGFVTPNTKVNVEGGKAIIYGSLVEDDHKYKELNMQQAFEASSNIAFAKQIVKSYDSNPNLHYNYIDGLGLNKSLKIHLFGAQPPIYLKPKNNLWSKSDLSAISRGYGISVTPLQMLTLYNAIANNGVMVNPFFVKKIIKSGQIIKEFEPEIINPQICKASTVKQLKNMLEGVVKNGTAYNPENQNLPYTFAGKTGTAIIQKGEDYFTEGKKAYRASWCGYFPAQKPKYSCFILITKPKGQMIYGSQLALPVFKDLANKIYATSFNTQKNIDDISPLPSNDLPLLVKAHKIEVKTALDQLGISSSIKNDSIDELASNWFTGVKKDNALELIPIINEPKKMPDVKGMSAKDALYLLECKGFKVNVSGLGKVVKQSIKPGSSYSRGVKVNLILG